MNRSAAIAVSWVVVFLVQFLCGGGGAWGGPAGGADLARLQIVGQDFPRAFFFRSSEGFAANGRIEYPRWERCFERLMGIMGKALDEEVIGREPRNGEFFSRFKRSHPAQVVLLHMNGNARDPRWHGERFAAGHWLYYNGARVTNDVAAEAGESEIHVGNHALFRTEIGRYRTANEDVGLCELDEQGRPDWSKAEQVQVVSIDRQRKVLRVKRGCYGTRPRAFAGGRAYAAAHVTEGPWGVKNNLLWLYNYSTRCPKDERGRTCGDVLAEHLAELLGPGGKLTAFDGLEFDVLHHVCPPLRGNRGSDADADGQADGGIFDGVNEYGRGVIEFCRELRRRLGERRIIQADCTLGTEGEAAQRAFGLLNGVESEGWPRLRDYTHFHDWSGGLNRLGYWQANARGPVFSYVNHKFIMPGEAPGQTLMPELPFRVHRLAMAAAVMNDAAICYSLEPADKGGELIGVWDELWMGAETKLGYLGKPLDPAVHLALDRPDVLKGIGLPPTPALHGRLATDDAEVGLDDGILTARAKDPRADRFRLRLCGLACPEGELVVRLKASAEPARGMPKECARIVKVRLVQPDPWGPPSQPKGADRPPAYLMAYLGQRAFEATFYFRQAGPNACLEFEFESAGPVRIEALTAHAHADAMVRAFERGAVLANPSHRPHTFDLAKLWPGWGFRRLKSTPGQDSAANDGSAVENLVTLQPLEGLFLVRTR